MKITLDFDEKIISLNHDVKIQELIEHLKKMNIEWEEWAIAWLPSYQWNTTPNPWTTNPWTTNPDLVTFSTSGTTKLNGPTSISTTTVEPDSTKADDFKIPPEELDELMKKLDVK